MMKLLSVQRLIFGVLPLTVLLLGGSWQALAAVGNCASGSTCVSVDGSSQSNHEQARQSKEQWDETKSLRRKMNARDEKSFDKGDRATDDEDRCNSSSNINAYWESMTRKCLDRSSGRPVSP